VMEGNFTEMEGFVIFQIRSISSHNCAVIHGLYPVIIQLESYYEFLTKIILNKSNNKILYN